MKQMPSAMKSIHQLSKFLFNIQMLTTRIVTPYQEHLTWPEKRLA
jgi:hypothetical protein